MSAILFLSKTDQYGIGIDRCFCLHNSIELDYYNYIIKSHDKNPFNDFASYIFQND